MFLESKRSTFRVIFSLIESYFFSLHKNDANKKNVCMAWPAIACVGSRH